MLTKLKQDQVTISKRQLYVTIRKRVENYQSHQDGLDRKQSSEHLGQGKSLKKKKKSVPCHPQGSP